MKISFFFFVYISFLLNIIAYDIPLHILPMCDIESINTIERTIQELSKTIDSSDTTITIDKIFNNVDHPLHKKLTQLIIKLGVLCQTTFQRYSSGASFVVEESELSDDMSEKELFGTFQQLLVNNTRTLTSWLEDMKLFIEFFKKRGTSIYISPYKVLTAEEHALYLNENPKKTLLGHEQWYCSNIGSKVSWQRFSENWCKGIDAESRVYSRDHIKKKGYKSILDVPCGMCHEYIGFKTESHSIEYCGVDIVPALIKRARERGVNAVIGNIEDLPFPDAVFDVCYARWILESLPYYTKALDELIRVARYEVIVTSFVALSETTNETIQMITWPEPHLFYNIYSKKKLEQYLATKKEVVSIDWHHFKNHSETVLHISVKNKT